MSFPLIYSKETSKKGRGVFAVNTIGQGELIENCPVIIVSASHEINLIGLTSLFHYAFTWSTDPFIIAIALGYGSLYNHSSTNNAFYSMNKQENTIDIIALKIIQPAEEITVNYMASTNRDVKQWFLEKGIVYVD